MTTPPPASDLDDFATLLAEVGYYENLDRLDRDDFDRYVRAEAGLEDIISAEAARRQKEFGFDAAGTLLGQFVALNTTQRGIAERELARTGLDEDYRRQLTYVRAAAAGNVLLAEGQQHVNRAERRRLAGDFEVARDRLAEAKRCFRQLADSDLPLQPVGQLRWTLAESTRQMLAGLAQMRTGDFKGAYQSFDRTHVALDELLADVEQQHGRAPDRIDATFEDLRQDLADGIRYVQAVQSFNETLRDAQNGYYGDAVVSGRDAVGYFQRIVDEAVARRTSRNAQALHETELARVNGWLSWVNAELAVDECRWTACREHVRAARGHWNRAARLAARNAYLGIVTQRSDDGNTDLLLQNTLRRCDRELAFRKEIDGLNARLAGINQITVGVNAMPSNYNFNAPVSSNIIGDKARIENAAAQQNAGTDLHDLATQLMELRNALGETARSPQEHESVAAVAAAQEAASRNDEEGVRRHLARAGRWALGIAEQLGIAAASAAIKMAIGG
ncbi:hypothetical protein [Actinoplanes sp. NPDC023714]|uniref:hypothetical protein n=1 Tax=Actinoplanes sp. NPDC023714 TaxID=3154322 RepID=UPI00340AA1CD